MTTKEPVKNGGNEETPKQSKIKLVEYLKGIGPGAIVVAGIIGPGSVTTASVMGATYGYQALWIMVFACLFAYFYQEPAIRITLLKKISVMEGIRSFIGKPAAIFLFITVLVGAIAFQAGNFTGAAMALNYFVPDISLTTWALSMAVIALAIAWIGVYKLLENINRALVALMILAFVLTAFFSGPSIVDLVTVGFSFQIPGGDYWLVLALLATTMPPNIVLGLSAFLHNKYNFSSASGFSVARELKISKFDLKFNMIGTAFITIAIIICAGTIMHTQGIEITSAADMAVQLTPLLGRYAGILFALGLWAAGFSSGLYQITLACMFMNQAFGWEEDFKAIRSKFVMIITSLAPIAIILIFNEMPVSLIISAQALNGLALPVVAGLVFILCNNKKFFGTSVNNYKQNIIYGVIMIVVTFLALRVFLNLFGVL